MAVLRNVNGRLFENKRPCWSWDSIGVNGFVPTKTIRLRIFICVFPVGGTQTLINHLNNVIVDIFSTLGVQ